jgi:hypothetical protein
MPARASENHDQFLLSVTFKKIDFIHTGKLANFTGPHQLISFRVFPTTLVNEETQENLLDGPEAFFAIRKIAIRTDDAAHSTQYCLDIVRSMAIHPASGAEMTLFLQVTKVSGTNFVVHAFNSCALQLPPP